MDAFITKYKSMVDKDKWVLKTGTVVEDNLFKFGKKCKFEHLCHSFIIDPNDETYLQRKVFTEEELVEIATSKMIEYPELPYDLVDYLSVFEKGTTSKELRKLIHISSDYQLDYDNERDQVKDWINRTLSQLVLLYKNPLAFATEHTEQWFQSRVWLFLKYALEDIENVLACRGEQSSVASSDKMNISRVVPSVEKIKPKIFGSRVDMIIRLFDLELAVEEDKPNTDSTKILEDRGFKIGKEMKDALWGQFSFVNYDKNKLRTLVAFGINTFKFNIYFDICDYRNGYIARLTRSNTFSIPTDLKRIEDILRLLSTVLVFKMMVQNNIDVLTSPASNSNLRQKLKRPFDSQEDGFVQAHQTKLLCTNPH